MVMMMQNTHTPDQCNYQSLNNYIFSLSNTPFEWGVHDCFTFVNGACFALIGHSLTKEDLVYDSPQSGKRLLARWLKQNNYLNFIEALDDRFTRLNLNSAPRGSLVMRKDPESQFYGGYVLGVSVGPSIVFISKEDNLIFMEYELEDLVWGIN